MEGENGSVVRRVWEMRVESDYRRARERFGRMLEMSYILIVVAFIQLYVSAKSHLSGHLKFADFTSHKSHLSKAD